MRGLQRGFFLAAAAVLLTATASALIQPLMMNFQGKLINPTTNNPQSGVALLTFKIYNVPTGGAALWTESSDGVALTNGVFNVTIGSNTALSRDLFLGASSYLEVTVVSVNGVADGTPMTPRTPLIMSPYAFTANQLSDLNEVRLIAGPTYSTFTSAGNLVVPGGVAASSGSFTAGVTASSGTFTATGSAQFSITTSSSINITAGILDVTGTSGIRADDTGITLSTIDFTGSATDPTNANAGYMYYNTSTGSIKVYDGSNTWAYVFGESLNRTFITTTDNTTAVAVNKPAAAAIIVVPLFLPGPMMVNHMIVDVTTALGAAGDLGIYNSAGTLLLNGGASTLTTTAGLKSIAPTQTGNARFLPPGQYYAAITFNSATGRLAGNTLAVAGMISNCGTIATGGGTTLPGTITLSGLTAGTIESFFEINP